MEGFEQITFRADEILTDYLRSILNRDKAAALITHKVSSSLNRGVFKGCEVLASGKIERSAYIPEAYGDTIKITVGQINITIVINRSVSVADHFLRIKAEVPIDSLVTYTHMCEN